MENPELAINWRLSVYGYSAKFRSQQKEYALEVWHLDQQGWYAKVNEEIISDNASGAHTRFDSVDLARKATERFALEKMMRDGVIK